MLCIDVNVDVESRDGVRYQSNLYLVFVVRCSHIHYSNVLFFKHWARVVKMNYIRLSEINEAIIILFSISVVVVHRNIASSKKITTI